MPPFLRSCHKYEGERLYFTGDSPKCQMEWSFHGTHPTTTSLRLTSVKGLACPPIPALVSGYWLFSVYSLLSAYFLAISCRHIHLTASVYGIYLPFYLILIIFKDFPASCQSTDMFRHNHHSKSLVQQAISTRHSKPITKLRHLHKQPWGRMAQRTQLVAEKLKTLTAWGTTP